MFATNCCPPDVFSPFCCSHAYIHTRTQAGAQATERRYTTDANPDPCVSILNTQAPQLSWVTKQLSIAPTVNQIDARCDTCTHVSHRLNPSVLSDGNPSCFTHIYIHTYMHTTYIHTYIHTSEQAWPKRAAGRWVRVSSKFRGVCEQYAFWRGE